MLVMLGNRTLGEFHFDSGAGNFKYTRASLAYFCPHCGEIWGRFVLLNSRGEIVPFQLERISCEKHPDNWAIAGSLLNGAGQHLLDYLPPAVLRRELELSLKEITSG